jgi:AcrR family transcriptional regulator
MPPRKKSTKGNQRTKSLMTAAIDLFIERDYSEVTIQDITARAGVTHSLVYYHFKNKEELFNCAVRSLIEETIESYQESRKYHDDPVDLIEDWFANNVKLAVSLRKLVKIMFDFSGTRKSSPSVAKAIINFYSEEYNILADNVRRGIELGYFKSVDPVFIASFVSTHIDGIFYSSYIHNNTDIASPMNDLKTILWGVLGYEARKNVI